MKSEQLGPYRIVRLLGRGGMGAVYQGVNVETDEPAAIKVLSAALAAEPDFRQRFEVEIETLRKLYHPNIVQLLGFGEQDGHLFYAMELVEGSSLEEELRRGRVFQWREVAEIGIQTCRALRHAHDRGVIHRDIKPANLLVGKDGKVKLSDFGIARLFGYARLTAAGNVLGTVEYMAPEQADGRPATPRTDLYSLGGVLYCLLARRPPFRAKSLAEMLDKHRACVPEPVGRFAPEVPAEMELLISQLLEKDPDKRAANATLVARRLEAMLRALSVVPDVSEQQAIRQLRREFDAVDPNLPTAQMPADELPPTRPLTEAFPAGGVGRAAAEELPETRAATGLVVGGPLAGPEAVEPQAPRPLPPPGGRFIPVSEQELDRVETAKPPPALISWQTWVLAAALVALGLTAWYLLQPPSADALYARITAATSDRRAQSGLKVDALLTVQPEIEEFLRRYSDDSRAVLLREYQREIELHQLQRQFERRAKGLTHPEGLLPIERAYLEAISYAALDPERGLVKLQALVDLYRDRTDLSGPAGQCLELARRQLQELRRRLERPNAESLAELGQRLERAEQLRQSDPETARGIWRAIVELYQDKPWAAAAVGRARQALGDKTPQGAPVPAGSNTPALRP
ncbi:MAG: serine/threonine protein kinase [Thermoguttaceae bacterium]